MAGCLGFRKKKSYTVNKVKGGGKTETTATIKRKPYVPVKTIPLAEPVPKTSDVDTSPSKKRVPIQDINGSNGEKANSVSTFDSGYARSQNHSLNDNTTSKYETEEDIYNVDEEKISTTKSKNQKTILLTNASNGESNKDTFKDKSKDKSFLDIHNEYEEINIDSNVSTAHEISKVGSQNDINEFENKTVDEEIKTTHLNAIDEGNEDKYSDIDKNFINDNKVNEEKKYAQNILNENVETNKGKPNDNERTKINSTVYESNEEKVNGQPSTNVVDEINEVYYDTNKTDNNKEEKIKDIHVNEYTVSEVKDDEYEFASEYETNDRIQKTSEDKNKHQTTVTVNDENQINGHTHVTVKTKEVVKTEDQVYENKDQNVVKTVDVNGTYSNGMKNSVSSSVITEKNSEDEGTTVQEPSAAELNQRERRDGIAPQKIQISNEKINVFPKDPDDEKLIKTAIEKNDFMSRIIRKKVMDEIIASMYNKEIAAKDVVIKQGDKGSHMYVSAKGRYQIIVNGKQVDEFSDVRVFGELAILYQDKRRATIKAVTSGRIWVLDQHVYQQIMYKHNIKEQDEVMELLKRNEKLNGAKKEVLQVVADLLKSEFFQSGSTIVRQGDKGNKFYIIRAGTVTITKDGEGVVGSLKKGDCFGELALLKEDTRQATVKANPPGVECLSLTRKDFIKHFGELESWKDAKVYNVKKESIKSIVTLEEYDDLNINDLKIKATIGVGGFGRVELVQHTKIKDQIFALKYLKKIDIVMQNQQEHVQNEKKIQMSSRTPFIVRMYKTYKDDKYIYFLMEACLGGDLWSLLQKQKIRRFEEKDARFICGCVLEALDYLHTRGIIYRDLKPENLLIDINGYIKLTDFGFAKKMLPRGKTYTFAGTPEYVSPEIVLNRGHDRAVDYWAYGAFVFEMLTGKTPFRTDDSSHMRTYNRILKGIDNVAFPSYVTAKARHLIEKLCRPIPADRLGMQKGGIKDIKAHRWYLGFDWQKLANMEIPSPFKPKLKGPTDTSYFDKFKKDDDIPPDEKSGWDINF